MKPDSGKRLAAVNGGGSDQCARPATGVSSWWLSGCCGGARSTLVARMHSRLLPGTESRGAREKVRRVVASKDERIACGRISCSRLRRHCGASAGGSAWMTVRALRHTAKVVWRGATCCQSASAANPQRVCVNNHVKRLVLKHEPRSLAPLRVFEWIKL